MTVEIAVFNQLGIAISADSAVTTGYKKTYTTANKIFCIKKNIPVGLMVYGNTTINGIPWELIIDRFKKDIVEGESIDVLNNYARKFVKFLKNDEIFFTKDVYNHSFDDYVFSIFSSITDRFEYICGKSLSDGKMLGKIRKKKIFQYVLKNEYIDLFNKQFFNSFDQKTCRKIQKDYQSIINRHINGITTYYKNSFGIEVNRNDKKKLREIILMTFTKRLIKDNLNKSGVVFVGYGTNENYPVVINIEFEECSTRKYLKYKIIEEKSCNGAEIPTAIIPYGQDDMITLVMNGINSDLLKNIFTEINTSFKNINFNIKKFVKMPTKSGSRKFNKYLHSLSEEQEKIIRTKILDEFLPSTHDPIMECVNMLPKEELAVFAETLINLTSFSRHMSSDAVESVGGPTDVALLSKNDGFVWVKKKNYINKKQITN